MPDDRPSTSRTPSTESLSRSLGTSELPDSQGIAHRAIAVTPQDTVIETADGHRLPGVPLSEARKLNEQHSRASPASHEHHHSPLRSRLGLRSSDENVASNGRADGGGHVAIEKAPAFTDPLFPPLPVYGPVTALRRFQVGVFRITSGLLSLCFLGVVVMGAFAESIPVFAVRMWHRLLGRDPDRDRPFHAVELERGEARKMEEKGFVVRQRRRSSVRAAVDEEDPDTAEVRHEGGPDKLPCDIGYYARRVGLEVETFTVETEDGFLLDLQHVYDPRDPPYYPPSTVEGVHTEALNGGRRGKEGRRRYPVLLMHGLLQSSGAFCVNDDDSLAFWLVKSGYDVFLGNNRCGFTPRHTVLQYNDPRMWAWNIRQMGILDLPAFISFILSHTSFPKLALIAHSQGTTQTFVALARQQRPELGAKISVFVALAPAVYAGPLINKFYFKFMKMIPPSAFRLIFGIHAFIPFMMTMNSLLGTTTLGAKIYGSLGYRVFWFLFGWSDTRWDRGLRNRFFRFAPVFVSAETMRWWLGRDGFARHRCILSTHEEQLAEAADADGKAPADAVGSGMSRPERRAERIRNRLPLPSPSPSPSPEREGAVRKDEAWFAKPFPKLALYVGGKDELVDGRRLLERIRRGKEPAVDLVDAVVLDEYEHLDVIWAVDAPARIFERVRRVIWHTMPDEARGVVVEVEGVEEEERVQEIGEGADEPEMAGERRT